MGGSIGFLRVPLLFGVGLKGRQKGNPPISRRRFESAEGARGGASQKPSEPSPAEGAATLAASDLLTGQRLQPVLGCTRKCKGTSSTVGLNEHIPGTHVASVPQNVDGL